MTWEIIEGDALERLRLMPAESVQTCITSPPYYGLRDYGDIGQLGLEPTPDLYVARLVEVMREVRRVLRDDGTLWLNLGDSYSGAPVGSFNGGGFKDKSAETGGRDLSGHAQAGPANKANLPGIKQKDLLGIPWMVAFALRADGWYLRSDIIWAKPNPMPESVTDRPTKAHEYVFLLSKGPRYFYDADAVREDFGPRGLQTGQQGRQRNVGGRTDGLTRPGVWQDPNGNGGRNKRSVWTVPTQPFPGAHFAVFPPKLIEPCVLAGSAETACGVCGAPWERVVNAEAVVPGGEHGRDRVPNKGAGVEQTPMVNDGDRRRSMNGRDWAATFKRETVGWQPTCTHHDDTGTSAVLDPFCGAGTTGVVADRHGRSFVGIELNPAYARMARRRLVDDAPLFHQDAFVEAEA